MAISSLEQHIAEIVAKLSPTNQRKVLDYALTLTGDHPGVAPENLLRFAGQLSAHDLDQIEQAIIEAHDAATPHE